jgi:hypothetical protein
MNKPSQNVYTGAFVEMATCFTSPTESYPCVGIARPNPDGSPGKTLLYLTLSGAKELQNDLREAVDACIGAASAAKQTNKEPKP